jgi:transposase
MLATDTRCRARSALYTNKPISYDLLAYRDRNRIERMWCRLKDWRRIATRYDKLPRNYLSGAYLVAAFACWAN